MGQILDPNYIWEHPFNGQVAQLHKNILFVVFMWNKSDTQWLVKLITAE